MIRICPKCGDYSADPSLAFCLRDGIPLVNVGPSSEKWTEGTRVIEEKSNALRKQKLRRMWRRVLVGAMTMLIATMVVAYSFTVERTTPEVIPSPSPSPSPSASPIPSPSPSSSPSPSPSPSSSPSPSPSSFPSPSPVYKISGRVMDASQSLSGVKITIAGSKTASTTTDANGYYTFNDLPAGGSYSLTPGSPKVNFTPPNRSLNNLRQDATADFFGVVQPDLYKISGRVTDATQPLGGVKVRLEGSKLTSTTTDPAGNYTFSDLRAGGSYTITPEAKMKFSPTNRSFDNLTRDGSADFAAQTPVYKISGRVTDGNHALGGVKITINGSKLTSTTTDANGNYTFSNLRAGGNYTITPKGSMNFTPNSRSFTNLTQDESADFSAPVQRDPTPTLVQHDPTPTLVQHDPTPTLVQHDPTPTLVQHDPTPTEECTDARRSDERNALIKRFGATWRRSFESEEPKILAESVKGIDGKPVELKASLGPIAYEVTFLKGCTPRLVTAAYHWQVTMNLNGRIKTVTVPKKKNCVKVIGGMWLCRI